MKLQDNQYNLA